MTLQRFDIRLEFES